MLYTDPIYKVYRSVLLSGPAFSVIEVPKSIYSGRRNNFPPRHVRLLTSDAKGLRQGINFTDLC